MKCPKCHKKQKKSSKRPSKGVFMKDISLENQITNFKLSKRLKELGIRQSSLWYWLKGCDKRIDLVSGLTSLLKPRTDIFVASLNPNDCGCIYYSAFTSAELGERLPVFVECKNNITRELIIIKGSGNNNNKYILCYTHILCIPYFMDAEINEVDFAPHGAAEEDWKSFDNNFANAIAKMVIWLIENGHICVNDV